MYGEESVSVNVGEIATEENKSQRTNSNNQAWNFQICIKIKGCIFLDFF
jgi:hypothetical protein